MTETTATGYAPSVEYFRLPPAMTLETAAGFGMTTTAESQYPLPIMTNELTPSADAAITDKKERRLPRLVRPTLGFAAASLAVGLLASCDGSKETVDCDEVKKNDDHNVPINPSETPAEVEVVINGETTSLGYFREIKVPKRNSRGRVVRDKENKVEKESRYQRASGLKGQFTTVPKTGITVSGVRVEGDGADRPMVGCPK